MASRTSAWSPDASVVACATTTGGASALIRLSGPQVGAIAARAGLSSLVPWEVVDRQCSTSLGPVPCRVLWSPAGRSFTGHDCCDILVPGAPDLVDLVVAMLVAAGALPAGPGDFTRQALAQGRISLDQAEAILALGSARSAAAARRAVSRLRGSLAADISGLRTSLIALRARVESGLDFAEEDGVVTVPPDERNSILADLAARLERWRVAADDLAGGPVVCLVGPANAGKSALFQQLSGAQALVSPMAGTTRDWLQAPWTVNGIHLRLIDTPGWLDAPTVGRVDQEALAALENLVAGSALVLVLSAPDARAPDPLPSLPAQRWLMVATKSDLGVGDPRARLAVSIPGGDGIAALTAEVASRLMDEPVGPLRQQRLIIEALSIIADLRDRPPSDEILADELRRCDECLADLMGIGTADEILEVIFARFCIGK